MQKIFLCLVSKFFYDPSVLRSAGLLFFPIMRHNSPLQCHIRTVPEDELNNEMFMTLNGPEIGELDEILKTVLDLHFKNS